MTNIQPKKSALILAGAFLLLAASSVADQTRDERIRNARDAFSGSTGGSGWNSSIGGGGGIPGIGATLRPPLVSPSR